MNFDILALECFVSVAETGSFTQAATRVNRTQSAVSQQIAKLESQIGKTLFIRGKKFILTDEGDLLMSYAKKIIQLNREAVDQFKEPELKGELRFGLPEDFASVFLTDVLTEYAALHPRIMLNIECDLTLNLFDRFKNKEFDLVLLKMNRPKDLPNAINVWSEKLEWVGNKSFFDSSNDKPIPLILSPKPCVYRFRAIEALEQKSRKWYVTFSSHSYAGKIAAVKAGMGVTVLPRNMIPDDLEIITNNKNIPALDNTHICLLKSDDKTLPVDSFEKFIIKRLRP